MLKGQIVRVVTTGGGGWGDPLQRELELVLRDVVEGKVSLEARDADYGVVFADAGAPDHAGRSTEAAAKRRQRR